MAVMWFVLTAMPPWRKLPIPQTGWALQFVDSQETGSYNATNVFDGNPNTMWATQWMAATPRYPHEIQIDLQAVYNITGFRYLPRQDGQPYGRSPSMNSTSAPMAQTGAVPSQQARCRTVALSNRSCSR